MFWERFVKICEKNNTTPTEFTKTNFGSSSNVTTWKKNLPNGASLLKIADCFDCSIDYLLGRTNNERSHIENTTILSISKPAAEKLGGSNSEEIKASSSKARKEISEDSEIIS